MCWINHKFYVADVRQVKYIKTSGEVTLVLYRCKRCPETNTKIIDGWWDKKLLVNE